MEIARLYQYFKACNGVATDTRKLKHGSLFFCLRGENFNGNRFAQDALDAGAKYVVYDDKDFKPASENALFVENSLTALQKLARYHREQLNIPVIGLTGSNGKTTTKELIYAVLSQKFDVLATHGNLNNHIGVPLTLLRMNASTEIALIEMGANHRGEIAFLSEIARPTLGYITNFGKAHLEGFGGVEGVVLGKSELYTFLKETKGIALVNGDDEKQLKQSEGLNQIVFGAKQDNTLQMHNSTNKAGFCVVHSNGMDMTSNLTGAYNFSNLNAAVAMGVFFELSPEQIQQGIASYTPTNNRSQWKTTGKNRLLLDAYNANPSSMAAALKAFSSSNNAGKVVILGDMLELGEYSTAEHQSIVDQLENLHFEKVYLVGPIFESTNYPKKFNVFKTTAEVSIALQEHNLEGKTILLKGSRGIALEHLLDQL